MGYIFLGYPGLQSDEVLAACPLFRISHALSHQTIGKRQIPIMIMTYLGALKTWLYVPVFRAFHPSYLSVRVLPLILGSAAIWLCFVLLERIHSRRAAWVGAALLASDSTFLLTSCFDWGPVVLQHLLSLLGIVLVVVFIQSHRLRFLALASFCFGLALWDKALFVWFLNGLILATVVVYPRELLAQLRPLRQAALKLSTSTLFFTIGCSPLIVYNVTEGFPTLHSNQGFSADDLYAKSMVLRGTWEGASLFGYLVNDDTAPNPRSPGNALERFSFWVRSVTGEHKRNLLNWAILALLLSLPAIRRTAAFRIVIFFALTTGIAWLQMAVTNGAGGATHHVVLLWPLPQIMIAVAFAEVAGRWQKFGLALLAGVTLPLVVFNLLVMNQYLYQFSRNGGEGSWTDAIYRLYEIAQRSHASYLAVIDWGIADPLDLMSKGRLPLYGAERTFLPTLPEGTGPTPDERLLRDAEVLWISHTDGNELFAGVNAGLRSFCERSGYQKIDVMRVPDRNGRPIFETFRLVKVAVDLSRAGKHPGESRTGKSEAPKQTVLK